MSPPPLDHRYDKYERDEYPTDMCETETDFSPPRSPDLYRNRDYRGFSPESPISNKPPSHARKGIFFE